MQGHFRKKTNGVGFVQRKLVSVLIAALLAVAGVGYVWHGRLAGQQGMGGSVASMEGTLSSRVNVLLIGADQRPMDKTFNTDSLILASMDPVNKQVSLVSIPRDTRVPLAGHGEVKINSVLSLTDLAQLEGTVSDLLGVPVQGYILTNFQGFKDIIDTLGGIMVDVEKDMYYETGDKTDGYINLHKGLQRLNGSEALQYARFRHDALADISRTARQQVVLKAVAKEMFQLKTIPKLPVLVPQILKAVQTNLSTMEILKLANVTAGFDSSKVMSQTLPGSFFDLDGVSYWNVDPDEAKKVVRRLFEGVTTDGVVDGEKVDLLKPVVPSQAPKVPGNSLDPNGQASASLGSGGTPWQAAPVQPSPTNPQGSPGSSNPESSGGA